MNIVPLSQVALINPRLSREEREGLSGSVTFLPMDAVSEAGYLAYQQMRPAQELMKGFTPFRRGDVIVAKITPCMENGKAAYLSELNTEIGFGSTEFHVIRPSLKVDGRYLFHQIWSHRFRHLAESRMSGAVGQKRVPTEFLKELTIALPPIIEQRRIAAVLDTANSICRKHDESLASAAEFLGSAFIDMFGDPVTNPKRLPTRSLSQVARYVSGATPSKSRKEYWKGTFPWVSPKDMKRVLIDGAKDHVADSVFTETNLKKIPVNTVLIVVRGMILAHTVPIGITGRELAINQDIKAIVFDADVDSQFGLWCLKVQHANLLSKVDTAAHGTKRLGLDRLSAVPMLIPPPLEQGRFVSLVTHFSALSARMSAAKDLGASLFSSLAQHAVSGDL